MAPKKVIKQVDKKEKNNKATTAKAAVPHAEMEDYAFITDQIGHKVVVPRLMCPTVLAYSGMLDQVWLSHRVTSIIEFEWIW